MKINWNMVNADMLDYFQIPNAPAMFRAVAENLILIASRTQFEYHTMSNLDKKLIYEYWRQVDGMEGVLHDIDKFREWFETKATNPELIRRARQWLDEHNYIIVKPSVRQYAQKAGERWRAGVK